MTLNGIDVSRYNAAAQIASWLPHIDFGLVCASQGTWLVGPAHAAQVAQLRAAGKRVGHYHYAEIRDGGVAAANYFLDNARPQPGDVLALDWEPFGQSGAGTMAAGRYVRDFAVTVHQRTGAWPWLYSEDFHLAQLVSTASSADLAVIRAMPLWKAGVSNTYLHVASAPAFRGSVYGWPAITGWQWSDLPLDLDVFYGSGSTWDLLAIPHPHTPTTAPTTAFSPIPAALTVGGVTTPTQEDEMKLITAPGRPWAILNGGTLTQIPGGVPIADYVALGLGNWPTTISTTLYDTLKGA